MCQCACCGAEQPARKRGFRPVALLLNLALTWVLLVVGSGTLINTGNPVATEAGLLIRTVTFVEPATDWADHEGYEPVANGLRVLARGIPVSTQG